MHKNFLKFYATFLFKTIDFKNVYVIIVLSNTKGQPIKIGCKGKSNMSEVMVSQLINANGNPNANQFVLHYNSVVTGKPYVAFQSYESRVCEIALDGGLGFNKVVRFGRDYNYSNTTSKHLNEFLRQNGLSCLASAKDRKEAIERGYARMNPSIAVVYDETME